MSCTTNASNVPEDLDVFDDHGDELAHALPPASMDALGTTCLGDKTELCSHCGMPVRGEEPHEDAISVPRQTSQWVAALVRGMSSDNIEDEQPATIVAPLGCSAIPMTPLFRPACPAPYGHSHRTVAGVCSVPLCATFLHEDALGDTRAFGYFHRFGLSMDEAFSSLSPAELTFFSSQWVVGDVEHHGGTKTSVLFGGFFKDEVLWRLPHDFAYRGNTQGVVYTFRVLLYTKVGDLYELVAYQDSPEFAVRNSKRKPTATLAEKNPKRSIGNAVTSA
ncbi:hypothetical protein SPRG_13919 [Saprolegnia parasitica CBS 223.65]|uniref:Uncharacterized protein n=1 Tax=Saprolegnia parasitica (strain CBS 223.65) TaxID=695850 RepID=A0A067BR53_SAPPC|nr:hypothetical protein SPRG_13919 [Saprolegnia parasitica CBS 223.65]KDO20708.1 hypothetical protein SPRG_13919 [Saprolegnia parasitica CBS 223.65]|eukprot:XP_012208589.1 hypothetical protein SPRG_13919 [Saprolegnia parasitica CBS 223.65]